MASLTRCLSCMGTDYAEHANFAVGHGFTRLFQSADGFANCVLTSRKRTPRRGGIYFWVAENGEAYVGKATSFRARLSAHLQNHGDIKYAFFKPVAASDRSDVEKQLILAAGRDFPIRNIKHAAFGVTHVPFDDIVSRPEREIFLQNGDLLSQHSRGNLDEFRRRQVHAFNRFSSDPNFDVACVALSLFISRVIPRPMETETRFWSVTLKPKGHLLRVNAGQQEVFTITPRGSKLCARVLTTEPSTWLADGPMYETDSYVAWVRLDKLSGWLRNARLQSARELVVGLMRQTRAINFRSHCPQLVDAALSRANELL